MRNIIYQHNVLQPWPLPDGSVDCVVTSPPYWGLRDYGHEDQLGQEKTPEEYVEHLVQVFTEAFRVLKDTGTLWLNLGDTYWGGKGQSGGARTDVKNCELSLNADGINYLTKGQTRLQDRRHPDIKPKDIVGIPWMVAFALRSAGWYLRSEIIWAKPNCMPESVTDRPTRSHEQIFLLTKSKDYYYDAEAIKENLAASSVTRLQQNVEAQVGTTRAYGKTNGNLKAQGDLSSGTRNKRDVWTVTNGGFDGEYCTACGRYFEGPTKRLIVEAKVQDGDNPPRIEKRCPCGQTNAWLSHFATFPPDLITDCIKAGSSQHGNCATCGSPWERVTAPLIEVAHTGTTASAYPKGSTSNRLAVLRQAAREQGTEYTGERVGWQPTCSCGTTEVVPALVLDCFMGSGTTALEARKLGRNYVGLDLNEHYIAMARARLREGQQAELTF